MSDHQRWAENMQRWEDGMMSIRDQFAAAAFAALLPLVGDAEKMHETCGSAFDWADAMLRERERQAETKPEGWLNYNANDYVRVRLTDYGRAILKKQHEKLNDLATYIPYTPPVEDSDGWSKWQLHRLMSDFGAHTVMGLPLCFETTIQFDATRTNHDAAPAARAPESEALRAGPPQPTDGTGTTQEPFAWYGRAERDDGGFVDCLTRNRWQLDCVVGQTGTCEPREIVPLYRQPQETLTESERLAIYTAAEWLSKLARSAAPERASQLFDNATTLLGLAGRMQ